MTSGGGTVPYRGSPGSKYTFDSRFTLTSPTLHGGARAGSGAVVVVVGTAVGVVVVVVAAVVDVAVVDVVELGAAVVAALESSPPQAGQTDEPHEPYKSHHRHHRRAPHLRMIAVQRPKLRAPGQCKDGRMDIELVLDCADLDRMTAFWTAALGYEHTGSAAQYAVLRDRDGRRPRLLLQRVDEPKSGKNRMHIDLSRARHRGRGGAASKRSARRECRAGT